MKTGIISALWTEIDVLHKALEKAVEIKHCGISFYTGTLNGNKVVLAVCGIGKVNAAICAQMMIDKFDVDALIQTGIAGSMDSKVGHMTTVVADKLVYHDIYSNLFGEFFPYREYFIADASISQALLEAAKDNSMQGTIITGDEFVSDQRKKEELKSRFPDALCVEMEGCAIAHTAFINNIPFGIVRCISDLANGDAGNDFGNFEELAAKKAASIVIGAIEKLS